MDRLDSPHTARAYRGAAEHFSAWCDDHGIHDASEVTQETAHAYADGCARSYAAATVKQRIQCLRKIFAALGQSGCAQADSFDNISTTKSARQHPTLAAPSDALLKRVFDTANGAGLRDLRDRALLSVLLAAFLPIRVLCRLSVATYKRTPKGAWLVFDEGFSRFRIGCPPNFVRYLESYIEAGLLRSEQGAYLFQTIGGASGTLTGRPLRQPDVFRIVRRLSAAAGVEGNLSPRQIRAAGLVRFLRSGGDLEVARKLAGHSTSRTTVLYCPPGTRRPRNRIAYRLTDLDDDGWDDYGYGL
jgi:site-specific recombinase XerD